MTYKELHINVEQSLQSLTSFTGEDFSSEEMDIALNKCKYRLVDSILEGLGDKGFQGDNPKANKLRNLLTTNSLAMSTESSEEIVYSLPLEYFREVRGKVHFKDKKKCKNRYTNVVSEKPYNGGVRFVEQQDVDTHLGDFARTSTKDSVVSSIFDNFLYLYTKGIFKAEDITKVDLIYLKRPPKIELRSDNQNVEYPMPNDFMEDLADMTALHLAKLSEENNKAQLMTSENIR